VIRKLGVLGMALGAHPAVADDPVEPTPLGQIPDDKQLSEALMLITQDPAIPVDDPRQRTQALALMIEGVKQLRTKAYDQALANFLEAYAKFPSPKILLNIGSTLRDMGRLADAANTYQRYLSDPATGADRVLEVKDLLLTLDEKLTILTIRVAPRLSTISIDAGSFIAVGSSLVTRVRPGLHLIRVRNSDKTGELTVTGFEGEHKEVLASIQLEVPLEPPPNAPKPPDRQEGWLITGQYGSDRGGNQRSVLATPGGAPVRASVPASEVFDDELPTTRPESRRISSGVLAVLRIDAEGRGFAGGLGIAVARGNFEVNALILRSNQTGGYLGARYRFLTGFFRPYVAAGIPGFVFDNVVSDANGMDVTETKLAIGARVAAGLELYINNHFSVQADFGYEHFWFVDNTPFVADVYVPTIGVIGRL